MDFAYILSSTQGRIPRSQWWAGLVVLAVIALVLLLVVGWAFGGMLTPGARIASLILTVIFFYPSYCISAKRFQDRNKPGSLALIGIGLGVLQNVAGLFGLSNPEVPTAVDYILGIALLIVGIWFLIELGILRGTIGPNQYGPDPLEGRP